LFFKRPLLLATLALFLTEFTVPSALALAPDDDYFDDEYYEGIYEDEGVFEDDWY
jgi:hypothetical protein